MKIKKPLYAFFFCLLLLVVTTKGHAETDPLKASAGASESWLLLIDDGKYANSWDTGSSTLKMTVPKDRWVSLMEQIRKPLGTVQSRKTLDQRTAKDPQGLPAGNYMVFFYDTAFSNKGQAHELVTLIQESDGQWRVLTYQVQ